MRRRSGSSHRLHRLFTRIADAFGVHHLTLVTASDCHLCEHAKDVLDRIGHDVPLSLRTVDVESAEAQSLAERGIPLALLPALVEDGRLLAYGRLSEKRLRKDFAA